MTNKQAAVHIYLLIVSDASSTSSKVERDNPLEPGPLDIYNISLKITAMAKIWITLEHCRIRIYLSYQM